MSRTTASRWPSRVVAAVAAAALATIGLITADVPRSVVASSTVVHVAEDTGIEVATGPGRPAEE